MNAIKFRKGTEKSSTPISTINFIYGQPGAGKTNLSLTASLQRKMLFIDLDNTYDRSIQAIKDAGRGNTINEENISVWAGPSHIEIADFLRSDQVYDFEYIALDSFTFLGDRAYREAMEEATKESLSTGRPVNGQRVYGLVGDVQKNILNIANERSVSIDFICHESEMMDSEAGYRVVAPAVTGQMIGPVLKRVADNIMYLRKAEDDEGNVIRELVTESDERIMTKQKDSKLPAIISGDDVNYAFISQYMVNGGLSTAVASEDYNKIKEIIADLEVCESMDELKDNWDVIVSIYGENVPSAISNAKDTAKDRLSKATQEKPKPKIKAQKKKEALIAEANEENGDAPAPEKNAKKKALQKILEKAAERQEEKKVKAEEFKETPSPKKTSGKVMKSDPAWQEQADQASSSLGRSNNINVLKKLWDSIDSAIEIDEYLTNVKNSRKAYFQIQS